MNACPAFESALILTGPTGSGKSALALAVAEQLGAEIAVMDSMTLYRGMDIGTAKPTLAERARIPHHLIDRLDPHESASVAQWLAWAETACEEIVARGKRPLFVGGTPLYLKALLFGLFDGPPADPALRARLGEWSSGELHVRLQAIDPPTALRLHENDRRRVIRALEVYEATGRAMSAWQTEWSAEPRLSAEVTLDDGRSVPRILCLDWPREQLYARIEVRVVQMIQAGWLDECRRLLALPQAPSREALQALGYRTLFAHLGGEIALPEAIVTIQTQCRNFAKRQLTWFRSMAGCQLCPPELTIERWGMTMDAACG